MSAGTIISRGNTCQLIFKALKNMICENPTFIYLPRSIKIKKPTKEIIKLNQTFSKIEYSNTTEEYNQKLLRKPKWHWKKGYYAIQIPCNECPACKLRHSQEWATRCVMEYETTKTGFFITLTYNNGTRQIKTEIGQPCLPRTENGLTTLQEKDVTKFIKRLRKAIYPQKIRYFYSGEYGYTGTRAEIGGNPHYHLLVFGWKPNDLKFYKEENGNILYTSKMMYKLWGMGFCPIGELNLLTAQYTAQYTYKKAGIKKQKQKREYIFKLKYTMEEIYNILSEQFEMNIIDKITTKILVDNFININKSYKIIKKDTGREEEFVRASNRRGIGYNYFINNKDKIKEQNGVSIHAKKSTTIKPLPRYFKKIWAETEPEEFYNWQYKQQKIGQENFNKQVEKLNYPQDTPKWKKDNIYRNKIIYLQKLKQKNIKNRKKIA